MANIAILVDTGTDVPQEYIDKYGIYMVPLMINYEALSYRDRQDITTEQVLDRLTLEIPKTSLPPTEDVMAAFEDMEAKGITDVLVVTISSGLSGTHNMMRIISKEYPSMNIRVIDTKNISIAAGVTAIRAAELVSQGLSVEDILVLINKTMVKTKVFFSVATLKYLQKGGRIGLVAAKVGTLLGINPIISCNDDGVYYTAKKARGRHAAREATLSLVRETVAKCKTFNLYVAHGGAEKQAKEMVEYLKQEFPMAQKIYFTAVSPALAVHTGPGLLGIGVQGLS